MRREYDIRGGQRGKYYQAGRMDPLIASPVMYETVGGQLTKPAERALALALVRAFRRRRFAPWRRGTWA